MSNQRIYLVEDHDLVRDGLSRIIQTSDGFEVIGECSTGTTALREVPALDPDIVLLDIDLPDIKGFEVLKELLAQDAQRKVGMVTMHSDKTSVERAFKTGAVGYFVKTADEEEFLQGLRLIAQGKQYVHADALPDLFVDRGSSLHSGDERNRLSLLSSREQEVLELIGLGATTREISERLFLSERTIETHRKNIHSKLGVKNLAGLIRFAIKSGLVH